MTTFDAGPLRLGLSDAGRIASFVFTPTHAELLAPGLSAPLLALTVGGKELEPAAVRPDPVPGVLRLSFEGGAAATVKVATAPTHLSFELVSVGGAAPTKIAWGPFCTTVGGLVGETVGVAREGKVAVGLQALNVQTVGAAAKTDFGSRLSAYAVEHEGGVKGSRIALFACAAERALETIGQIEVAEGLPHPMLDGVWGKISPTARLSYLICPFGEGNLDFVLAQARQAGLKYLYHPGPFATWGHFKLNPGEFSDGDESMARCVQRAQKLGVRLAVHTLTAFITTNDPYVTPVPDPRLGRSGTSKLTAAVDDKAREIPIADPEEFRRPVPWEKPLNTVIIGQELVRYEAISADQPWRLLRCQRGAWGTHAAAHPAGADIGKLADHNYNTFYPGIENGMMDEMAARLVQLINRTGLRQLSYDGLEGLCAYGYPGEYSRNRFVKQVFEGSKVEVISDASNLLHYLWHIHTRMNWGEPWGKAMREGMAEYRFNNQEYFERNLLPGMLGWWELRTAGGGLEASSVEDFEWMYARAAAFDAGFAITTYEGALRGNAQSPAILDACREWETARHAHAFTAEQRRRLREPGGEWHLEAAGEGSWRLLPLRFLPVKGPQAKLTNPFAAQPLRFLLRAPTGPGAGPVGKVRWRIGDHETVFPVQLQPGQYLVCRGEPVGLVCDANWYPISRVTPQGTPQGTLPTMAQGEQAVEVSWEGAAQAQVTVKLVGPGERVGR